MARYSNFKTPAGALLNIYKTGAKTNAPTIKTNLFGKLEEINPQSLEYDLLDSFNCEIKQEIIYIDPNNTILKDISKISYFEELLNDILALKNPALKVSTQTQVTPATKRATTGAGATTQQQTPAPATEEENQQNAQQLEQEQQAPAQPVAQERLKIKVLEKIKNFFSEFNCDVMNSNRFINTLQQQAQTGLLDSARDYVVGYFSLIDHPELDDVKAKILSPEFESIFNDLNKIKTTKKINNRLEILFGPAGTGKTTKAIQENPTAQVIPCHSAMTTQELFENFDFINGAPVFKKSALLEAMEQGRAVILDEINLLDYEVIRALQTITDNKKEFNYKNNIYTIKDGFKIIGTMNLVVNGRIYPLSEPLVDRCSKIEMLELPLNVLMLRCF